MKKLVIGLLMAAVALPAVPAVAQPDRNWSSHDGDRHDGDNRGDNRDRRDDRHDNRGWDQRDSYRHGGWGQDRGARWRWDRGQRMGYRDWNNAQRIDYRRYRLRPPPRGYEWRRSNDRFVLVAVATGLIASVILFNGR